MAKKNRNQARKSKAVNKSPVAADQFVSAKSRKPLSYILTGLALLSVVAVAGLVYMTKQTEQKKVVAAQKSSETKTYTQGGVYQCRKIPKFIAANEMRQPVAVDTKQSRFLGPVFREVRNNGKVFRKVAWEQAGHVGPVILDKRGDVYIIPVPAVSLDRNPPAKQNRVYRIDGDSADISVLIELPGHELPDHKNPFGAMGQAYDCETDSLYVSSVAGSTPAQEKGKIFQIDIATGKIISTLDGFDSIGLGVFNLQREKRLYFGSARNTGVYSVELDHTGGFISVPRYEFALSELSDGSTSKVKKIRFSKSKNGQHLMTVSELDFDFRLIAQNTSLVKRYIFELDPKTLQWRYLQFVWQ